MCFLDSICTIITVFQKYAEEDGDYSKLSRKKMKELIQTEFADVIAKPRDPQTIDKILWFLEWDGDGEIDFNEFLLLVCRVAKACYWYLPRGPLFLQKTKLTASGKTLQEPEEGVCDPNRCRVPKGEGSRPEKFLYRTVEVDDSDSPPGEPASVSDVRVHYIPAEPDVQPEVQVLPPSCKAENIAYLIHVIQNLNDPEATTYEIVCHQPNEQGPPIYVKKCYVSPQPLAAPRDRSNAPEPRPQRDEREAGEPEGPREGGTPASSFKEKTGRLDELEEKSEPELKEGAQRASAFEMDGVKDDPGLAKTKEDRSDSRRTTMPDLCPRLWSHRKLLKRAVLNRPGKMKPATAMRM